MKCLAEIGKEETVVTVVDQDEEESIVDAPLPVGTIPFLAPQPVAAQEPEAWKIICTYKGHSLTFTTHYPEDVQQYESRPERYKVIPLYDHTAPCARCAEHIEYGTRNLRKRSVELADVCAERDKLEAKIKELSKLLEAQPFRSERVKELEADLADYKLEKTARKWAVEVLEQYKAECKQQAAEIDSLRKIIDEEAKDSGAVIIENESLTCRLAAAGAVIEAVKNFINTPITVESCRAMNEAAAAYQKGGRE